MNINSLLPKIDELREIVKISNLTVTGIIKTKLDNTISDSEISIDGYCAIRRDRNRKGGGVICYVANEICYNTKNCISNKIENIFIELLIPKTKPITVGIVYKPPDLNKVSRNTVRHFKLTQYVKRRVAYTRGLNINLYQTGSILEE